MKYYSTNHQAPDASLEEAVVKGLASDKGLYMPEAIKPLPQEFYDHIEELSFQEIAYRVADAFFGEDVPAETLRQIVYDTLSFDVPAVKVKDNIYALELFHGPTLAFKDVGGRFMARLLGYFIKKEGQKQVNVLVATSGDTGSAVANGFLGVEGIHVYVLYPKGKVSEIQEKQFTTLGQNITALEVDGTFDDCQALVKNAFMDADLNAHMKLTSANSINVARFLPQAFCRPENTILVLPSPLLPMRWMWEIPVTSPVYWHCMITTMLPLQQKSPVPPIRMNRSVKRWARCIGKPDTCSIRTELAVIVLCPKGCSPARRVFSWKRLIRPSSLIRWKASLAIRWRFLPNCRSL